jgi:hypothetical protein
MLIGEPRLGGVFFFCGAKKVAQLDDRKTLL